MKFSHILPFIWLEKLPKLTIIYQEGCNAPIAKFWRVQIYQLHPFCLIPLLIKKCLDIKLILNLIHLIVLYRIGYVYWSAFLPPFFLMEMYPKLILIIG